MCIRDSVYRSADGGATWQAADAGLPTDLDANTGVEDLLLDPANPDVLYACLLYTSRCV